MRPTSRSAAASSFWRGYGASLRRSWLGRMVPAAMVAATRRMSAQFRSIRSTFSEQHVEQTDAVAAGLPRSQVREGLGEPGGVVHLEQDVRDPRVGHSPVEVGD